MKNIFKFLLFILYSTAVFFLPNNKLIFIFLLINTLIIILLKINIKSIVDSILKVIPFVLFTFIINCFMDNVQNAFWIGLKLIIVCYITVIYSKTTTVTRNC